MNEIYREFESHLAGWQRRYAGRPESELLRLYLLALEREENVAVAYAKTVLGPRLAALYVPEDVRTLMRHALARVWEDEEMHVVFVRRALGDLRGAVVASRALFQQAAGAMGGWTVAVRQHRRWRDAPLACTAATMLLLGGEWTGRVPRAVRRHLGYVSFRDFCRYNAETESTAWLCWRRIAAIGERLSSLPRRRVDEFARIAVDEERHRRVFEILADALTDEDRLREGVSTRTLETEIGSVAETFLPSAGAGDRWGSLRRVYGANLDAAPENRAIV